MKKLTKWTISFVIAIITLIVATCIFNGTDNDSIREVIGLIVAPIVGVYVIFLLAIVKFE